MIELKILIFWLILTAGCYLATKIHYNVVDTPLRWKYFKQEYSLFGGLYYIFLYIGILAISLYGIARIWIWIWFFI